MRPVTDGEKQEAGWWARREGPAWRLGMCSQQEYGKCAREPARAGLGGLATGQLCQGFTE